MATAQGLYAQVVMVRRKGSDNEKGELKKKKYKFVQYTYDVILSPKLTDETLSFSPKNKHISDENGW